MKIKINKIDKIEGHGSFEADIINGRVKEARFKTLEGARLVEGILVGRQYFEPPIITARICGICPVVHNLTAIKALENALGVKPSQETVILRKVMELAQVLHSHALHIFFLALPDFYDFKNSLELAKKHPRETRAVVNLRNFGNKLIQVIGGRTIHPQSSEIGGFKKLPSKKALEDLIGQCPNLFKEALFLENIFCNLKYPNFTRDQEYVSLTSKKEYSFYEGDIGSTSNSVIKVKKFMNNIEEIQRPYELIKHAKYEGQTYMVGALARLNINKQKLNPRAKEVMKKSGVEFPSNNNFHNILAQCIEMIHCVEEIDKLIKLYLKVKNPKLKVNYEVKAGSGVGSVEAPRGTLFHYYELNKDGRIINCNIITPTAQMTPNLEEDLKVYLKQINDPRWRTRHRKVRALVRAYDPCMTCATH